MKKKTFFGKLPTMILAAALAVSCGSGIVFTVGEDGTVTVDANRTVADRR